MRITGGHLRSRQLRAPRGTATRPTSDRVREALFGILTSAGALDGARVLDLYCGTGALALEALSRGALHATLVDSSRDALEAARANVDALGQGDRARVVSGQLGPSGGPSAVLRDAPYDLVLADPPWALVDSGHAAEALGALAAAGAFAEGAVIVLEHAARSPAPEVASLGRGETRRYGDTALTFYKPAILGAPRVPDATPTFE